MRIYTAHLADKAPPVLVREGFSLAALLFGPFWLLTQRAWIAAALSLCAFVAVALLPPPYSGIGLLALAWLHGLFGQDIRRVFLTLHGFTLEHVLAGGDEEVCYGRLLAARPDLTPDRLE